MIDGDQEALAVALDELANQLDRLHEAWEQRNRDAPRVDETDFPGETTGEGQFRAQVEARRMSDDKRRAEWRAFSSPTNKLLDRLDAAGVAYDKILRSRFSDRPTNNSHNELFVRLSRDELRKIAGDLRTGAD